MAKLIPALYIRCSSEEAARSGHTIEAQFENLKKFVESQNEQYEYRAKNYQLKSVTSLAYIDGGFSGANEKRPELQRLYVDAAKKKFNIILVWRIDRFYRNTRLFLNGIQHLSDMGIMFRSMNEPFDTSSPFGKMALTMLGAVAELERAVTIERANAGRIQAVKNGNWIGGKHVPFGYKIRNKKLFINRKEAKIIRLIFNLFVEEKLTGYQLLKRVTTLEIPTPDFCRRKTKTKKIWQKLSLIRLIANPVYTGRWWYNRYEKAYGGGHFYKRDKDGNLIEKNDSSQWALANNPQIISQKTFDLAQKQLLRNRKLTPSRVSKDEDAMLRYLIVCGEDNHKYSASYSVENSRRRVRYFCSHKNKTLHEKCCRSPSVEDRVIEPVVWREICKIAYPQQRRIYTTDKENEILNSCQEKIKQSFNANPEEKKKIKRSICKELVERIVIKNRNLDIYFKLSNPAFPPKMLLVETELPSYSELARMRRYHLRFYDQKMKPKGFWGNKKKYNYSVDEHLAKIKSAPLLKKLSRLRINFTVFQELTEDYSQRMINFRKNFIKYSVCCSSKDVLIYQKGIRIS